MASGEPKSGTTTTGHPAPDQQNQYPYPPPGAPPPNPTGMAYPYPPPPNPYPPQNYYYPPAGSQPPPPPPTGQQQDYYYQNYNPNYPPQDGQDVGRRLIRIMIIAVIAFFIFSGFITFITFLMFHPEAPLFSVTSANVTDFNLSSGTTQLTSQFKFDVKAVNPNKKLGLLYAGINAGLQYKRNTLNIINVPPFFQPIGLTTMLPIRFATVGYYVNHDMADEILLEKAKNGGVVEFNLQIVAQTMFEHDEVRMKRRILKVYCDDIKIAFSNTTQTEGTLLGPEAKCTVIL